MAGAGYDVIVVGLGAMGSSALYQLSRRGLRVLGLEAFQPGHQLGSFHGESRVIRLAYYEHPSYVPLLQRAYGLWSSLEAESGEELLRITGGLMLGAPESELVKGSRASAEMHGLAHDMLSADEVRHRYPALQPGDDEVALWEPRAGYLRPERCIQAFVRLANAETQYADPVRGWHADQHAVEIQTDSARYVAEKVVFTCGARHSQLLGGRTPTVTAERIPLFWLQPSSPELFEQLPVYLWEAEGPDFFYGFPHVEWPGVKVARHHSREVCDPETIDRTVSARDDALLRNLIEHRVPGLNGPVVSSLVCMYENSPDEHFVIDRLDDHANVIYAAGFSGHGFKFASVVGEIVADLVTTGKATADADFLKVNRFG